MGRLFLIVVFIAALVVAGTALAASDTSGSGIDPRLVGHRSMLIFLLDERIFPPDRVVAGRTLVIQENAGSEPAHMAILRLPDDVSLDEVRADLAAADRLGAEVPDWFSRAIMIGNPDRAAPHGGHALGLVNLAPGRYVIVDPDDPARFARFEAISLGQEDRAGGDPSADVIAELDDTRVAMPDQIPAGTRLWQVANGGDVPRELVVIPAPADATEEQVVAAYDAALDRQPVPVEFGSAWNGWNGPALANGVGATSPGQMVWPAFDLEPGAYAAITLTPSIGGAPQLTADAVKLFTVTADDNAAIRT